MLPPSDASSSLETADLSDTFFAIGYVRMQFAICAMAVVCILLLGVAGAAVLWRPAPQYFPTGPGCQFIPMHPLSEPVLANSEIIQRAIGDFQRAYSFDYANYEAQWADAAHSFSDDAWASFVRDFKGKSNEDTMRLNKLVVSNILRSPGEVIKNGVYGGVYMWRIRFRATLVYQTAEERTQDVVVEMVLARSREFEGNGEPVRATAMQITRQ